MVWTWDFHVGDLKFKTPCQRKEGELPSGSSSSHRACLVRVISPMWFESYFIGAEVLPCVHQKDSGCGFSLSLKKKNYTKLLGLILLKLEMVMCSLFEYIDKRLNLSGYFIWTP